jgi:hypothetical protein
MQQVVQTLAKKWPKCDASNSQTGAYFQLNYFIDRDHYFCVGQSKNLKVFPLSNQGADILSMPVDRTQYRFSTAGM